MSATNDNRIAPPAQRGISLSAMLWATAARLDCWPVRAGIRTLVCFPVGGLAAAASELSDANGDHATAWVFAGASAAALVAMLRWFARRDGGMRAALKLTLVSWGFVQSLVVGGQTVWTAAGMAGTPNWAVIGCLAGVSMAIFVPTATVLCRLDPD